MSLKLTENQRRALRERPEGPVPVEDEQTHKVYVIVDQQIHQQAMQALREQKDLAAIQTGIDDITCPHYLLVRQNDKIFGEIRYVKNGQTIVLSSKLISGTSGRLEFETIGNQLTLRLNNTALLTVTDSTLASPGLVGIFLGANGAMDDFSAKLIGS